MNALRFKPPFASPADHGVEASTSHTQDYVFLALDERSPLCFLERVGLILWLAGCGRDGFGL
jgi:hypothetical protein